MPPAPATLPPRTFLFFVFLSPATRQRRRPVTEAKRKSPKCRRHFTHSKPSPRPSFPQTFPAPSNPQTEPAQTPNPVRNLPSNRHQSSTELYRPAVPICYRFVPCSAREPTTLQHYPRTISNPRPRSSSPHHAFSSQPPDPSQPRPVCNGSRANNRPRNRPCHTTSFSPHTQSLRNSIPTETDTGPLSDQPNQPPAISPDVRSTEPLPIVYTRITDFLGGPIAGEYAAGASGAEPLAQRSGASDPPRLSNPLYTSAGVQSSNAWCGRSSL